MSYELEIQKSFPAAFYSLNGTRPPMVAGSGSSTLMTTATSQTFAAWVKDREESPFSIEAWFLPMSMGGAADLLVFGHSTEDEGVFYDGSGYFLRIKFSDQTLVGRWNDPEIKARYLVMTYDVGSVNLYVDGERVISLATPRDGSQFLRATGSLTLNSGGGSGVYDALALYYRALPVSEIKEHFALGRAVSSSVSIASSKGATTWNLTYADVDVFQTISYNRESWNLGYFTDVSYAADRLEPSVAGGTWQVAIPLGAMVSPTTSGVHLRFVGDGVTLEWSIDAVTWAGIENKTTVLEDADTTDLTLFVRLTLINETSWVESLTADLLGSRVMQPFSGIRKLVFKDAEMNHAPGHQLEFQADMGAELRGGGYLDVPLDTSDTPIPIRAVEFWAKKNSTGNEILMEEDSTNRLRITDANTIAFTIPAFALWINGVSVPNGKTNAVAVGEWNHYMVVFDSARNTNLRFGGRVNGTEMMDISIYGLSLYPEVPTGTYEANIGAPGLRVDDTGGFSLSESATPYDIYAYAWSIVGGSN